MDVDMHALPDDVLEHYGIRGMKWGVRRYQNPDGTYTELGLERERAKYESTGETAMKYRKQADRAIAKAEKAVAKAEKKAEKDSFGRERAQKKADKALEKAAKKNERAEESEKEAAEANESYKKALLASGSADDLLNYKGSLSSEELNQVINRINKETTLKELSAKQLSDGWYAVDAVMNKVSKVTGYVDTARKAYDTVTGFKDKVNERREKNRKDPMDDIVKSNDVQKILDNASKMTSSQLKDAAVRQTNIAAIQKHLTPDSNASKGTNTAAATANATKTKQIAAAASPKNTKSTKTTKTKPATTAASTKSVKSTKTTKTKPAASAASTKNTKAQSKAGKNLVDANKDLLGLSLASLTKTDSGDAIRRGVANISFEIYDQKA